MKIISLASSSSGNAHIVEHGDSRVMLDCGLTKLQLQKKGVQLSKVDGILLTHAHL